MLLYVVPQTHCVHPRAQRLRSSVSLAKCFNSYFSQLVSFQKSFAVVVSSRHTTLETFQSAVKYENKYNATNVGVLTWSKESSDKSVAAIS
jgi:hypothetical protein